MAVIKRGKNANRPYTVRYWHEDRQREKSFRTKREADDFIARFEHERREGSYVDPKAGSVTFGQYANRWLEMHVIAPTTKRTYRSALDRWLIPALGGVQLRRITRERLRDLLLVDFPNAGAKPGTVARCHQVLSAVFAEAERERRIAVSPARRIRIPSAAKPTEFTVPTPKQLRVLADAMPGNWGLLVMLAAGCGLRMGEALAVKGSCSRDGFLRVTEQRLTTGLYGPLKHRKPGAYRDTPLPEFVAERWPADADGYLFAGVGRKGFNSAFRKAAEAAGLPAGFTFHDLRHRFASVALSNGVPLTDVAEHMGHNDVRVTAAIYGHLLPNSLTRARQVLDAEMAI